jgi:hypothetical protein
MLGLLVAVVVMFTLLLLLLHAMRNQKKNTKLVCKKAVVWGNFIDISL